ncbi:SpoIID/LytB domain-containing protein [Bacillus timonensis]|uniref:SpoIID/LytB domain-containing protein n=1 Tax=Bacillus timonensis TaxID=1033734 RepID=UPI000289487C|nr:SpoIID/LytB domain-containing protein [Bacillus timonensis]
MKKFLVVPLLSASLLVSSLGTTTPNAVHAASDKQVTVKLNNYLKNEKKVEVNVSSTYQLSNNDNITLSPGQDYFVRQENSSLNLYKGSSKVVSGVKEFSLTPAVYQSKTLSGQTRYDTSTAIANEGWSSSEVVVLGRGDLPLDALTGSVLAKKFNAPLLLSRSEELPDSVLNQIKKLNVKTIYILGGTGAISQDVENKLTHEGITVIRVTGDTRYATSVEIAGNISGFSQVFITSGDENSPDALSIASYAAKNQIPILLTKSNALDKNVKQFLVNNKISKVFVIGGDMAVSDNVIKEIKNTGISNVERVKGTDRYATSIAIAEKFNFNKNNILFAQGQVFIDALPGAVLAAQKNAPVLLTRRDSLPASTKSWLKTIGVPFVYYLGGNGAISNSARNDIKEAFMGDTTDSYISLNNRPYFGDMKFTIENGNIRPYNTLPFELYLKGVVPSEMPASWHVEALKAQAVAARTYALSRINSLDDTVSSHVYGGYIWKDNPSAYVNSNKAVEETAGQVLSYNDKLISAVYSSSNGGHTESNSNYWGTAQVPYLQANKDDFDPKIQWSIEFAKDQINTSNLDLKNPDKWWNSTSDIKTWKKVYGSTVSTYSNKETLDYIKKYINDYYYGNTDIKIVSISNVLFADKDKNSSGKMTKGTIVVDFFVKDKNGTYRMNEKTNEIRKYTMTADLSISRFRSMFGATTFKSYHTNGVTNSNGKIIINGLGYGHGVGMSQYGAQGRAKAGHSYKQILKFYYPGAELGK